MVKFIHGNRIHPYATNDCVLFFFVVVFVNFPQRNFFVTEPAVVEIQIAFSGGVLPFDINVTVEIDVATATGKY